MQSSSIPTKFPIPFANNAGPGYINPIPEASQRGTTPGAASLYDGFPPENFDNPTAGGTPTRGQDWNGLQNQVTSWLQWAQAGAPVGYDSAFSAEIGGYPKGALIAAANLGNFWLSTVENNTSDPDTGGANWILCALAGASGGKQFILASTTLSVPPGVYQVFVQARGGGGGGAGGTSGKGGGGGGAGAESLATLAVSPGDSIVITIGGGGAGGASGANNGSVGGTTTIVHGATTITCTGGGGGQNSTSVAGAGGGTATGGNLNMSGSDGSDGDGTGILFAGNGAPGWGGNGAGRAGQNAGQSATAPGAGGGGAYGLGAGGNGFAGCVMVEW